MNKNKILFYIENTFFRFVHSNKSFPIVGIAFECLPQRVQFQAKIESSGTYPYSQLCGDVTRSSSCVLRVEVGLGAAQERRFEDVTTAAVVEEAALVQVHLLTWSLEVQSHCTAAQGVRSAVAKVRWAQCSAA